MIPASAQDDLTPPECINLSEVRKMIVYPESAKEDLIEGRVTIKILVGTEGDVEEFSTLTGPAVFYKEIKRVSKYLKFTPAIYNNEKVKCWVLIPFSFKMQYGEDED